MQLTIDKTNVNKVILDLDKQMDKHDYLLEKSNIWPLSHFQIFFVTFANSYM